MNKNTAYVIYNGVLTTVAMITNENAQSLVGFSRLSLETGEGFITFQVYYITSYISILQLITNKETGTYIPRLNKIYFLNEESDAYQIVVQLVKDSN